MGRWAAARLQILLCNVCVCALSQFPWSVLQWHIRRLVSYIFLSLRTWNGFRSTTSTRNAIFVARVWHSIRRLGFVLQCADLCGMARPAFGKPPNVGWRDVFVLGHQLRCKDWSDHTEFQLQRVQSVHSQNFYNGCTAISLFVLRAQDRQRSSCLTRFGSNLKMATTPRYSMFSLGPCSGFNMRGLATGCFMLLFRAMEDLLECYSKGPAHY